MSHTDLNRRIDEVLGRGLSAPLLVDRLNNAFLAAKLPDRVDTLSREEIDALSDEAVATALDRLSHRSYDRDTDDAARAAALLRKTG